MAPVRPDRKKKVMHIFKFLLRGVDGVLNFCFVTFPLIVDAVVAFLNSQADPMREKKT